MMKKIHLFLLALCAALLLTACVPTPTPTLPPETLPPVTESPVTEPSPTEPPETEPEHSAYYIPNYTAEDVSFYFQEVVLYSEFPTDPEDTANFQVKRWEEEIRYVILGDPTEEDLATVRTFWEKMQQISGFPPVTEVTDQWEANFTIHFSSRTEIVEENSSADALSDGYATIWWNDDLQIYSASVYICSEVEPTYRQRVILHELFQSLGMMQDSGRQDSIIYFQTLEADDLSPMDWLIVTLLYHPDITTGMDAAACTQVIESLYY